MSITFRLSVPEDVYLAAPHEVFCACPDSAHLLFPNGESAWDFLSVWNSAPETGRLPLEGCNDDLCLQYPLSVRAVGVGSNLAVNVSQSNARHILSSLGLPAEGEESEDDLYGEESPESFLGRVLLAMAVAPVDESVPSHSVPGLGARFVECGRREDYTQDILERLHALATEGIERGWEVTWG